MPNKTKYFNLNVLNMAIGINEPRKIMKHLSCKCEIKLENDNKKCMRRCKKSKEDDVYKKRFIFGISLRLTVKMINVLEVLLPIQSLRVMKYTNGKIYFNKHCSIKQYFTNFYIFLTFSLFIIVLLAAGSIYRYFIKNLAI